MYFSNISYYEFNYYNGKYIGTYLKLKILILSLMKICDCLFKYDQVYY